LKYLIDYIFDNKLNDLNDLSMMKHFILWKYPSLNFALKYISYKYSGLKCLHKYCMNMLENAKNTAIIFYMPQLIQSFRTQTDNNVEKFIIKKSKESSRVAHQFLWSLEVEEVMGPKAKHRFLPKHFVDKVYETAKIIRLKILKNFNPMQRKFFYDENLLFSNINEISAKFLHLDENPHLSLKMEKSEKTKFVRDELQKLPKKIQSHIYLPTNPNLKIVEILPYTASSLQSAKKVPFIVSFTGKNYEGPDSDYLVTQMNFSEFIKTEIYEYLLSFGNIGNMNIINNSLINQNNINLEVFNSKNNNIVNKSTANTHINYIINNSDNDNALRFNTNMTMEESLFLNNQNKNGIVQDDDDLIIYDEQDNFSDLNVPHLDIKLFAKPEEKEESLKDMEVKNFDIMNIDNLSNCTDNSEFENEEKIYNGINYRENFYIIKTFYKKSLFIISV